MTYLLDTNVVSEMRRRAPDPRAVAWLAELPTPETWLSVLTIGELWSGIYRLARRDPQQADAHAAWAKGIEEKYASHVLPVARPVVMRWAALQAIRPLPHVDGLLAATALEHGLIVATRNVADFEGIGVKVFNPFL